MTVARCDWLSIRSVLVGGGALIAAAGLACGACAAGPFDGTYAGRAALVSGNNGTVCKSFPASMTIADSHLSYAHAAYGVITADVAADGSFSGSGMLTGFKRPVEESLKGKVVGGAIEADVSSQYCAYHISLQKRS
jgi:hypothetical protein